MAATVTEDIETLGGPRCPAVLPRTVAAAQRIRGPIEQQQSACFVQVNSARRRWFGRVEAPRALPGQGWGLSGAVDAPQQQW